MKNALEWYGAFLDKAAEDPGLHEDTVALCAEIVEELSPAIQRDAIEAACRAVCLDCEAGRQVFDAYDGPFHLSETGHRRVCRGYKLRALAAELGIGRFPQTWCSQCGQEFGPGDEGFSHCEDHRMPTTERKGGE